MKIIPLMGKLGCGRFAAVDDEDYKWLSQWGWHYLGWHRSQSGYVVAYIGKEKTLFMHRIVNNTPQGMETDHKDLNGLNNQKYNLRTSTKSQNNMNRKKQKGLYTSKYKGVSWDKRSKTWHSQLHLNNKGMHIGYFKNEIDAAVAYNNKAIELFGEFARPNKIEDEC